MGNPKDFLARQIRTNSLILSGGTWAVDSNGGSPGLLIYSASLAPNYIGGRPDKVVSGSGNYGLVQIYQSNTTPSGGFANSNVLGQNIRMYVGKAHAGTNSNWGWPGVIAIGSGSHTTDMVSFYSGSSLGPGVFILSQSLESGTSNAEKDPRLQTDVNFWVSGSKFSKGSASHRGTAVFGGDLVVSGTLYAEKQIIEVDISRSGSLYVSGSAEVGGGLIVNEHGGPKPVEFRNKSSNNFLYFDPVKASQTGMIGLGNYNWGTNAVDAMVHIANEAANANAIQNILKLTRTTTGTPASGIGVGINFEVETAGNNIENLANISVIPTDLSANSEDGAVVFKTMTGGNAASEKFRIGADETVVNEGGNDHDFRVESGGEDEAIFLNAGDNELYINRGETAFETRIANDNDVAITVSAAGVIFNEDGHATNDFRVETDNNAYGLFINAGTDQVFILTSSAAGVATGDATDVNFIVSGSRGKRGVGGTYGTALFGGDVHASGSITADGGVGGWTDAGTFVYPTDSENVAIGYSGSGAGLGNSDIFLGNDGSAVFNQQGADSDFRIEGQNDQHLFTVDASTDSVGINVAAGSHGARLDVNANDASEVGLLVTNNPGSAAAMGDVAKFISGSAEVFSIGSTDVVVNEGGASRDFRVESSNQPKMLQVQGSSDSVGIGAGTMISNASLTIAHPQNSGKAWVYINNESSNDYDTQISFAKQETATHSIGVDDSDSDKFKIALGAILGGSNKALMDFPSAAGSAIVVNEDGLNHDFRIEGQNDANLFVIDASADSIGINVAAGSIGARLDILQNDASSRALLVTNNPGSGAATGDIAQFISGSAEVFSVGADDVIVNEGGNQRDFRVESVNQAGMLFVDASEDTVAIGTIAVDSNASLHITHPQDSAAAILLIENESSGNAYDAQVSFAKNGTTVHSIGMDDSDSDKLKIALQGTLGASNKALMDFPSAVGGAIVINEDGRDHDFRIETTNDDKAFLIDAGNDVVVINEDGDGADFRVETALEDEAFFIDSSANIVYINKGETAVGTRISSVNDIAITVAAAGVIFNEDGHATNDFRVESDSNDHAIWVDSGANFVGILTGSQAITGNTKAGTDVCFFVSGSNDKDTAVRGVSVFGGDVVVSGTIYDKSGNSLTNNYGKMAVLDSGGNTEGTSIASGLADTFKLKEGSGIGLSINAGSDQVTISANFGSATNPAFVDRGFQTGHPILYRGTSVICTSSISFVSGNHIGGVSPVAYDASNVGADVFFFVSGSEGGKSKGAAHRHGVSCFGGDLVVSGTTHLIGSTINLGDSETDAIVFNGRATSHLLPKVDSSYNLGSATRRWANIYTGDLHLRNDRGNWTIYEEPDMLVVVNNLTGKKYKMGLTPLEDDE